MSKYIIITGGGTGGHLSVARSFIDEFYKRGYKVIFVGSTKGQDKQWFENYPKLYKAYFLDTKGVVNQNFIGKFISLFMIFKAVLTSIKIINTNNVSKVVSVGGFSAASASFAAFFTRTDFYIHEQNSVVGRLNKITSKYAKEMFSSYLPDSKVKDYPISQKFFENSRIRKEIKTIIFLGGSQGAKAINNFAVKVAPKLNDMGIKMIHQTGKNDFNDIKEKYDELKIEVDVFDFSTELLKKMNQADFSISRAGASTLWELVALGIPSFFIPYPYAAANHQYFNAKYLLDNDLCFLQTEKELDENYFFECLKNDIENKSKKLINTIHKNAVKNIANIIE
ncbi:MAG: UDP-N-acetylglucosamine--N-acetylmuramyl-(pentapeptide) pyrophosphoryl-undecaprenol N-acetylglucosamine transferase [Campylobacterota bacterium]|nr:UDP-N-acetylglucosamine--N-acetylmuramyl-(pentapeptide) pyrophosphoryl-undecaprenol N-acetylglucosamine transferase [Campylobacterota bacterium]